MSAQGKLGKNGKNLKVMNHSEGSILKHMLMNLSII
jgi:hypothetical protein